MNLQFKNTISYKTFHLYLTALFLFFLPLKFGTMTGVPEIPLSWTSPFSAIFENCPPVFFPICSAILFISSLIAAGNKKLFQFNTQSTIALLWLFLALSSLLGFINASTLDFPVIYSLHFWGLAIFAFAILLTLNSTENSGKILLRAIVAGNSIILFSSLHQILFGFKNSLDFVKERELYMGTKVSYDLWLRITQTRVFSPFALCNSLAANIILTLPIITIASFFDKHCARINIFLSLLSLFFIFFDKFGKIGLFISVIIFSASSALIITSFFDEYWKIIARFFSITFSIFAIYILQQTYSRGAVISLAITSLAIPFFLKIPKKIKFSYILLLIISFSAFFIIVNQNRSLLEKSSLHARLDYWLRASEIFFSNPLTGTGWGDFFHDYTKIKKFPGTEAPHTPHNIIMNFSSQCGIIALMAIVILLSFTIYQAFNSANHPSEDEFCPYANIAIFYGITAYFLHSLTDINFQVPATIASTIALSIIVTKKVKLQFIPDKVLKFANFALLPFALLLLFFSIQRAKFEREFDKLHRICNPIVENNENLPKNSIENLKKIIEKTTILAPYSPYPWATAGVYTQNQGLWDLSEIFFENALKNSPERASFYYRLAISQLKQGKFTYAAKNLKKAHELFPNNEEYSKTYEKFKKFMEDKK